MNGLQLRKDIGSKKANLKWLVEGDRNTKFFHQSVQKRKQNLKNFRLKNEQGVWITDGVKIKKNGWDSFKKQLNGSHLGGGAEYILNTIPSLITSDQNDMLTADPTMEELHNV